MDYEQENKLRINISTEILKTYLRVYISNPSKGPLKPFIDSVMQDLTTIVDPFISAMKKSEVFPKVKKSEIEPPKKAFPTTEQRQELARGLTNQLEGVKGAAAATEKLHKAGGLAALVEPQPDADNDEGFGAR